MATDGHLHVHGQSQGSQWDAGRLLYHEEPDKAIKAGFAERAQVATVNDLDKPIRDSQTGGREIALMIDESLLATVPQRWERSR